MNSAGPPFPALGARQRAALIAVLALVGVVRALAAWHYWAWFDGEFPGLWKIAAITPLTLTVSATGQDKVYDGTTSATVALSDNRIAGDVFTDADTSANFSDKNVGTGKPVTVASISITGACVAEAGPVIAAVTPTL